jgi:hypothetical protein
LDRIRRCIKLPTDKSECNTRAVPVLTHVLVKYYFTPWWRGIVVIASASRTEDPGFESRQSARFLGPYALQCRCHCTYLRQINALKYLKVLILVNCYILRAGSPSLAV